MQVNFSANLCAVFKVSSRLCRLCCSNKGRRAKENGLLDENHVDHKPLRYSGRCLLHSEDWVVLSALMSVLQVLSI